MHFYIFGDGKPQLLKPSGGGKPMAPTLHYDGDIKPSAFNHGLRDEVMQMLQPGIDAEIFKDVKIIDDSHDTFLVLRRGNDVDSKIWESIGLRPLEIAILATTAPSSTLTGEVQLRNLDGTTKCGPLELPALDRAATHQARRDGHLAPNILPADIDRFFDRLEAT